MLVSQYTFSKHIVFIHTVFLTLVLFVSSLAHSQDVITDLSKDNVPIEWNFTGTEILLFGAVDVPNAQTSTPPDPAQSKPDVIIVVRGPNKNMMTRQKRRIAGIWVNTQPRKFKNVPGYYSIVSTRPIEEVTTKIELETLGIGFDALALRFAKVDGTITNGQPDDYSEAIVRIMKNDGLYSEKPDGVQLIGNKLFRANISLPTNVPVGTFDAIVYLFQGGKLLSITSQSIYIEKQGFERLVYSLAFDYPFLYGLLAVLLAILSGLAASAIFRKD